MSEPASFSVLCHLKFMLPHSICILMCSYKSFGHRVGEINMYIWKVGISPSMRQPSGTDRLSDICVDLIPACFPCSLCQATWISADSAKIWSPCSQLEFYFGATNPQKEIPEVPVQWLLRASILVNVYKDAVMLPAVLGTSWMQSQAVYSK